MAASRCCMENDGSTFFFPWFASFFTVFFLLSVCSLLDDHRYHEEPQYIIHTKNASARQLELQQFHRAREIVFRNVFRKLRDEQPAFRDKSTAVSVLHGSSQRRAFCGGWESDIPSLVLRSVQGHRCPPITLA